MSCIIRIHAQYRHNLEDLAFRPEATGKGRSLRLTFSIKYGTA